MSRVSTRVSQQSVCVRRQGAHSGSAGAREEDVGVFPVERRRLSPETSRGGGPGGDLLDPLFESSSRVPGRRRHSNFSSFQRQLNNFGFRKVEGKGKLAPCMYLHDDLLGLAYVLPSLVLWDRSHALVTCVPTLVFLVSVLSGERRAETVFCADARRRASLRRRRRRVRVGPTLCCGSGARRRTPRHRRSPPRRRRRSTREVPEPARVFPEPSPETRHLCL